ncbi:DNA-formamidopyrimidine glycosylase [Adhaeribacter sp. BT258]|uniref:Formamidopyrimidine-DNA glycosylase n=1 Tax=Adhaeribacter terrigena TaxID=2793070 RepID=A0ABS1C3Q5_9BACT|nr:DNA-formamidopyrimidine glycosylase [Adhaeribacter terrigena]MBK0404036.1 DNA-formamidopyrimidine glycosylase [Adhaeribacter terrigena]
MPELPEVETLRKYLEATSMHQKITGFTAVDAKRQITMPAEDFREQIMGRQMVKTTRIGKHLLVTLDNGKVLSLHFGMTGDLHYYRIPEDAPRFERATFFFDSGFKLAFADSRKFGRIGLWESETVYKTAKKLGPDALEISGAELAKSLRKRKTALKSALLDQKILAGIGNWLVDEILFQAKLHPEIIAAELTDPEIQNLLEATQNVLQISIEEEAVYRQMPATFLIHSREWDDSPHAEKDAHKNCPRCKTEITKMVVGGRATYICTQCQQK